MFHSIPHPQTCLTLDEQACNVQTLTFSKVVEGELFCSSKCAFMAEKVCSELEKALRSEQQESAFYSGCGGLDPQVTVNITHKVSIPLL